MMTQDESGRPPRAPERCLCAVALRVGQAVLHRLRGDRAPCAAAPAGRLAAPRARRQLRVLPRGAGRHEARGRGLGLPGQGGRPAEPPLRRAHADPRLPPWRLPATFRHLSAAGAVSPYPPLDAYYIDALAVDPAYRRLGVARTLLGIAETEAQRHGLRKLALDTGLHNLPARALYGASGFSEREIRRAPNARTAQALGGPGFVGLPEGPHLALPRPRPPGPRSSPGRTAARASARQRPRRPGTRRRGSRSARGRRTSGGSRAGMAWTGSRAAPGRGRSRRDRRRAEPGRRRRTSRARHRRRPRTAARALRSRASASRYQRRDLGPRRRACRRAGRAGRAPSRTQGR